MNKEWFEILGKYEVEGARAKFEKICTLLYKKIYSNDNVRNVKVEKGDGGIDIFIGKIGIEPISVIQCKFFPNGIGDSQKQQIRESFKTVMSSDKFEVKNWILCIANILTIDENIWWSNWKKNMILNYALDDEFIDLGDGDDLDLLLRENNLYNIAFEKEDSIILEELKKAFTSKFSINDLRESFRKTSFYISKFKNYFGDNPKTHINRLQVEQIINWIGSDLAPKQKNVLIIDGEKGNGKTVIIKDVYEKLLKQGELVLCIKSDKYYHETPSGLEDQLFANNQISFSKIKATVQNESIKLIVIIDQLDALSQTLSANREYLNTYNRIISELENVQNIRVVISVRSFDLNYDANLSIFNGNEYEKIKIDRLSEDAVISVLNTFNVTHKPKKLLELLRTPHHLEIFSKLPNKHKVNIDNLYSLKDLYDELWLEVISSKPELKTKKLMYKLAEEMYDNEQKIVVQNKFNDEYFQELSYLKSNQILIEDNNEIQFFHQTLYDYAFSRSFVDKGNTLQSYIKDNGQSIYIRSVIKMIFEYLRDTDIKVYIDTLKIILESSEFRFHIKTLVISTLGLIQNPTTKEKQLAISSILYNIELKEVFINSINSEGWTSLIIEEKYFDEKFSELGELAWHFFRKNINHNPVAIIKYLEEIQIFENRHNFIENVISYNNNWESTEMLAYFETYISYHVDNKKRNIWYFDILEKISTHHIDYAFGKIRTILLGAFKHISLNDQIEHYLSKLIKKLESNNSDLLFKILLEVYNAVLEQTKDPRGYDSVNSPYYLSNKLHPQLFKKGRRETIEDLILKYITELASNEKEYIHFFNEYKNSNSILQLYLVLEGLKQNIVTYKKEIFELIQIIHSKNGFKASDDKFQFSIRKLIGLTFMYFSEIEKQSTIQVINTVSSPYEEIYISTDFNNPPKKRIVNNKGKRKYLFLKLIPYNELKKNPKVQKEFNELGRKFEPISDNRPLDDPYMISYSPTPPLPSNAYENMTLEDWENSMIKFNDDYRPDWESKKGGLEEHAKSFSDIVRQNPENYISLISSLFENERISKIYTLYGVEGLLDAKYNIDITRDLFKRLLATNLNNHYQYTLISKIRQIIEIGGLDKDIFSYLINIVKDKNEFKNNDNKRLDKESLVSIRGEAIWTIIGCYKYTEYSQQIFEIIEEVIEEDNIPINLSIISKLAYLNKIDLVRAFNIFLKIVDTNNIEILKNSFWSAKFFNNCFHYEMYPYFDKIMEHEELHENGNIIVISWINEKINDKELYNKFITKSKSAKLCALKIAEANLLDEHNNIDDKCYSILFQFLKEIEEDKGEGDFAFSYSGLILRKFNDEKIFATTTEFLKEYSLSKHCKNSPAYFLQYLTLCSKTYPLECFTLLKNIDFNVVPNIQNSNYYREEPVQLLLAIYSVMSRKPQLYKEKIEEALDLFDGLMKHTHLREASNTAIEMTLN